MVVLGVFCDDIEVVVMGDFVVFLFVGGRDVVVSFFSVVVWIWMGLVGWGDNILLLLFLWDLVWEVLLMFEMDEVEFCFVLGIWVDVGFDLILVVSLFLVLSVCGGVLFCFGVEEVVEIWWVCLGMGGGVIEGLLVVEVGWGLMVKVLGLILVLEGVIVCDGVVLVGEWLSCFVGDFVGFYMDWISFLGFWCIVYRVEFIFILFFLGIGFGLGVFKFICFFRFGLLVEDEVFLLELLENRLFGWDFFLVLVGLGGCDGIGVGVVMVIVMGFMNMLYFMVYLK